MVVIKIPNICVVFDPCKNTLENYNFYIKVEEAEI